MAAVQNRRENIEEDTLLNMRKYQTRVKNFSQPHINRGRLLSGRDCVYDRHWILTH